MAILFDDTFGDQPDGTFLGNYPIPKWENTPGLGYGLGLEHLRVDGGWVRPVYVSSPQGSVGSYYDYITPIGPPGWGEVTGVALEVKFDWSNETRGVQVVARSGDTTTYLCSLNHQGVTGFRLYIGSNAYVIPPVTQGIAAELRVEVAGSLVSVFVDDVLQGTSLLAPFAGAVAIRIRSDVPTPFTGDGLLSVGRISVYGATPPEPSAFWTALRDTSEAV